MNLQLTGEHLMVTKKQLNAFFKHLRKKYPMEQAISLKLYDAPFIHHPIMPSPGFCSSWSDRALIEVATQRDFPFDAAFTLAHEFKHCIQRFIDGKRMGNLNNGIQERNNSIEEEADRFADAEVASFFEGARRPTAEESVLMYLSKQAASQKARWAARKEAH